jgi:hypothetical protein
MINLLSDVDVGHNPLPEIPRKAPRMKTLSVGFLWLMVALPAAANNAAPDAAQPDVYIQVWLGGQRTDDDAWKITDSQSGENVLGDLGTLPFGGGGGQQLWGSGAWQFGYEGGGMVTWKNDNTHFRGANNSAEVTFDNTFVSFGVFMGALVSVTPIRPLRLYVAAGPSVTWAWVQNNDNNDNQTPPQGTFVIDTNGTDDDVSVVPYVRAGVEFVMQDGFTFGVCVRYADDKFNFGNAGDLEFNEPLWLLTLGSRL